MVTSKDHDGTQQVIRRWSRERLDLKIDQLHHLNAVGETELRERFVDRPDPAQQFIILGSAYHIRIECERRLPNRFEISRDDRVLGIGHTPRREACPEMMYSWMGLSAREFPWPTPSNEEMMDLLRDLPRTYHGRPLHARFPGDPRRQKWRMDPSSPGRVYYRAENALAAQAWDSAVLELYAVAETVAVAGFGSEHRPGLPSRAPDPVSRPGNHERSRPHLATVVYGAAVAAASRREMRWRSACARWPCHPGC